MTVHTLPDLRQIIDPLLGTPYDSYDCWNLVRHCFQQGFGFDLARDTEQAATRLASIWDREPPQEPMPHVRMWDLLVFLAQDSPPVSTHVGLALDDQLFVHARRSETGVALGRLRTWRPYLLQVARLRELF